MRAMIYCELTDRGEHLFYLAVGGEDYFLFSQDYRKGVQAYFSKGVALEQSMKYSKAHNDSALERTMTKLPMYIKYIEKEYEIEVLEKTKKRNSKYNRLSEMRYA